ncbi:MBL fold metallo-hydrolase [bacterium]|nr:MBL fold metallo-hydrolase [Planktomarina sp.]MDC1531047.1 MBL fold metallo-hydrolase [bacterium]
MTVNIETFTNGPLNQNCYIIGNSKCEAIIVDPGSNPEFIVSIIKKNDWFPLAIINTHAHHDHIGAVSFLMKEYKIPFYLHGDDASLLLRANTYSLLFKANTAIQIPEISHDLRKFDTCLKVGKFEIQWIETPGHTRGSICFIIDQHIFTGDTLLANTFGRTDLPGGDLKMLKKSIAKLDNLDPSLLIRPGHGEVIDLGHALKKSFQTLRLKK